MKPLIQNTSFGFITIEGKIYDYDVLIRSTGKIEKRKKKLSKKVYGTSHILSLGEADFISEEGVSKIIVDCGQYGSLGLSDEAREYFHRNKISVVIENTAAAIQLYNQEKESCIGLFHITC